MCSIGSHSGIRSRTQNNMKFEQSGGHSYIPQLKISPLQQACQELTQELEGKGCKGDKSGGMANRKRLSLAPDWEESVIEFVEEKEKSIQSVSRDEVKEREPPLGLFLRPWDN